MSQYPSYWTGYDQTPTLPTAFVDSPYNRGFPVNNGEELFYELDREVRFVTPDRTRRSTEPRLQNLRY